MFGRMRVLNRPRWSASSSRSWTISKGIRASIECLVPPEGMVLDLLPGPWPAVEPRGLLRVDQRDPGQWHLVPQVALGPLMPLVELLDDPEPAAVAEHAGELREPGSQPVRDPVREPDANLRLGLHRVLPAVRLLHAHAEDAPDWLVAPSTARYSLALLPLAHGGMSPLRAWRSANKVGASSPMVFMSSGLVAPPPAFGITQESGLILRTSASQSRQSSKRRCWCQTIYARRAGSWGSSVPGSSWPVAAWKFVRQCSQ